MGIYYGLKGKQENHRVCGSTATTNVFSIYNGNTIREPFWDLFKTCSIRLQCSSAVASLKIRAW